MTFWISYDLEINGDYAGMYRWLDNNNAIECGDSFAVVPDYESYGNFLEEITLDLDASVNITKRTRIYVIFRNDEGNTIGKFIFGKRRKPPWTGYGDNSTEQDTAY